MYYFVNIRTGQLLKINSASDAPDRRDGWKQITEYEYDLFLLVAMEYCRDQIQRNMLD